MFKNNTISQVFIETETGVLLDKKKEDKKTKKDNELERKIIELERKSYKL